MNNKELQLMYKELDYGLDLHNNVVYLSDSLDITDVRYVSSRFEVCRRFNIIILWWGCIFYVRNY